MRPHPYLIVTTYVSSREYIRMCPGLLMQIHETSHEGTSDGNFIATDCESISLKQMKKIFKVMSLL